MEKQSIIRILILIILSVIIIYFIYSGKIKLNPILTELKLQKVVDIDSVISEVFKKHGILQQDILYKKVSFEKVNFVRDEIIVGIPVIVSEGSAINLDTLVLLIHYDLKNELSKYNYKVSGVENLLEKMITLFIKDQNRIIKTIVLKVITKKERSYSYQLKNKRK